MLKVVFCCIIEEKGRGENYTLITHRQKQLGKRQHSFMLKILSKPGVKPHNPYVTVHVEIRNYFSPQQGTRQAFLGLPHHHTISTSHNKKKKKRHLQKEKWTIIIPNWHKKTRWKVLFIKAKQTISLNETHNIKFNSFSKYQQHLESKIINT